MCLSPLKKIYRGPQEKTHLKMINMLGGQKEWESFKLRYQKEYNLNYVTVRPANTYGPFDTDPRNAMVIPSLINKAILQKMN